MVAVAFVSLALTVGSSSASLPLFYGAIADDLGWSYTDVTLLFTYKNVAAAAATLLIAGPIIAGAGLRAGMAAAFALTAAGMALFVVVDSRLTYYAAGIVQGVGIAVVIVGVNVLVSRWFDRNRGFALGIALSGLSAGGALFPLLMEPLIEWVGWRAAMLALGLMVGGIALPLYLWKAREYPSAGDLDSAELRGRAAPARQGGRRATPARQGGGRVAAARQRGMSGTRDDVADAAAVAVIRSPAFIRSALALLLVGAADMAVIQHTSLLLRHESEVGEPVAALVLSVIFLSAVVGKLLAGRVYDRFAIAGISLWPVFVAASIALVFLIGGVFTVLLFAVCRGVSHGGLLPKPAVLAGHSLPPARIDIGLPLLLGVWMVGAGVGPPLLSALYEHHGHYRYGVGTLILLCLIGAVLLRGVRCPETLRR